MQQAANIFIQNTVTDGSCIGIVYFSSKASTKLAIQRINDQTDRNSVSQYIPSVGSTGGGTCIGNGMEEAMNVRPYFLRSFGPN
jgi:hypothetical protein